MGWPVSVTGFPARPRVGYNSRVLLQDSRLIPNLASYDYHNHVEYAGLRSGFGAEGKGNFLYLKLR